MTWPARLFWALAAYSLAAAAFTAYMSRAAPSTQAEARFKQRQLETTIRMVEGQPLLLPEEAEDPPEQAAVRAAELAAAAEHAATLAQAEDTPAELREQAAAVWLVFRAAAPEDAIEALLPPIEDRGPLSSWLLEAAHGRGLDAESLAPLKDVEMSPWLYSRLKAFAGAPHKPLDADSTHASGEEPYVRRALLLFSVYMLSFLAGLVLMVVAIVRRQRIPNALGAAAPPVWGFTPWVGWFVFFSWFSFSFTLQLVVGGVSDLFGGFGDAWATAALATQVAAGIFAIWTVMAVSGRQLTFAGALADLRVGLQPFDGRASRALLWALGGFLIAVAVVYSAAFIQELLRLGSDRMANPVLPELIDPPGPFSQLMITLSIVIAAPFFEELVFRGCLYRQLRARLAAPAAMMISSAVFGAVHFDLGSFVPLFLLGCVLALLTERSGGLLPAMLVHALWNGGTILIATTLYGA